MKKLISFLSLLFAVAFISNAAQSQVTVSGSTGANGTYTSLTDVGGAFLAINSSAQTGNNIVISITADVLTETGANSLNQSSGTWTSLTISPSGGSARIISGSFLGALVNLNGADNVTIDGLNTGGNSLTIANTAKGASSTIRFIADASNNTITNCTVQGSDSLTTGGVIFFSTGTTSGNDGNNINNCNIGPAGSNLPLNGIFSLGTSAAIDNSGNIISNNNISDYFGANLVSNGIFVSTGNSTWTISNNKLFQTANRTYTTSNTHNGMSITSGAGYTITGNVIGFANSSGTGTTNMIGLTTGALGGTFPSSYTTGGTANALRYIAINCAFLAAGPVSSIQNNTIAGFALYTNSTAGTTNGILCGINVNSGNVDIGTTTGNTIGSTSGNGSIYAATTGSGGTIVGINTSTANTINIQNNTFGAIDAMGTTASIAGAITGISSAGTAGNFNISNNAIGNTTNPNLRMGNLTDGGGNLSNTGSTFGLATGFSAFKGILNSATGIVNIGTSGLSNIIRNVSLNSSNASTTIRGIEHTSSGGTTTISNNSISNITTASTNTSLSPFSNFLTGAGILVNGAATGTNVTQNTINGLSLSNSAAVATNVTGIGIAQANTLSISRNVIYDLSNASTSASATTPGSVSGIFIRTGNNTPMNIFNNMITLGNSQTTNTCFVGIWGNHGQTNNPSITNIFYNSVYITGTAASGALPSFGYLRGDLSTTARTPTVDIRNNIFNNDRTGGTGSHYAISNNYGATASATGWGVNASNFNVLNSASASTVGYWTVDQTFTSWKTASASDNLSLTAIPVTFLSFATGDLHLNMGLTPTRLESGGIAISGFTTDIDGQTRPGPAGSVNGGAFAPDFGADEFDGVPNILTAPKISYDLLLNSSCYISQALTAAIFDSYGLNTSPGLKPRVFYRKQSNLNTLPGTNDNTTDGWKYAEASNTSSPFNFTIDYSIVFGGVGSGDVIEYFVVAQDTAATPNVGINTGTFTTPPTSVALAVGNFPITGVNSFNLTTGLSGIVTIGASGTYTTLTNAGGLFAAINSNGLNGNLIAEILDANITETGLNALNTITYGCSPGTSLTIRPASGVTTLLSGSSATTLIDFNNADNITIDGSNNGSNSKDMTIRNTGTGSAIRYINGATNDTVRSCIVESQNTSLTSGTILFSTSTGTTGNSNIVISGCDIRDRSDIAGVPANAVYSSGTTTLLNANNKISGCNIFNWTNAGVLVAAAGAGDGWVINPSSFYQTASRTTALKFISIQGGNGHSIINNSIGGTAPNAEGSFLTSGNAFTGIELSVGTTSATSVQGNTIRNIRGLSGASSSSYGINVTAGSVNIGTITGDTIGSSDINKRIEFNGAGTSTAISSTSLALVNVSNNIVDNITLPFTTGGSIYGISLNTGSAATSCSVINNTVINMTNNTAPFLDGPFTVFPQTWAFFINVRGVNTIRGNTVSNIGSISTVSPVIAAFSQIHGMVLNNSLAGTIVEKNKISGLFGSSSPTIASRADLVVGFSTGTNANATFSNNEISIDGGSNPSNRFISGINEESGNTAAMNYYYNSVNIYGTSNGSNNTYAFTRVNSRTNLDIRNNVFSNIRAATSTGFSIALANQITGVNTPIGWPSTASNYNALNNLNSTTLTTWGTTNFDLAGFQNISGGDSYTLFGDPGFTSNTNLLPDGSNVNSWTLKGNGIALSTIGTDIVGTLRSTSVMTGGTDIGAYEFSTTVPPPNYNNATGAPGIYKFIHKLDTMATVNVTTLGTLADVNVQYFSGEDPPGLAGDPTVTDGYGNVYWEIHPTNPGNSGYTYNVTLHYSPALIGTITNEANIKVAKNTDVDTLYVPYTIVGTGPGQYELDTAKNNITVYGLTVFSRFIITDGAVPLPVEFSSFTSTVNRRDVNLNWSTAHEANNSGFDVERKSETGSWAKVGNVNGNGTTTSQKNYSFTDKNLSSGKYDYRLKQIDFNGNFTYFNLSNEVNVGLPTKFDLSQNYPNPFNPTTKINYDLPVDGKVSIRLYDISGREVATLVNEIKTAGYYTLSFNATNFSSGMYFYRITTEGNGEKFVATKKMVLVK